MPVQDVFGGQNGPKRSPTVQNGHQRAETVRNGHEWSGTVTGGPRRSPVVRNGPQRSPPGPAGFFLSPPASALSSAVPSSERRRVGEECERAGRFRWLPYPKKNKNKKNNIKK